MLIRRWSMWSECGAGLISACCRMTSPLPGDWVLIHVGFAMSKISEQDAFDQMNTLRALGEIDGAMQEVEGYGLEEHELASREADRVTMRFVDEFREPELISRAAEEIRRLAGTRAPLPPHGSVRRAHARHLSLRAERYSAGKYRTDPRAGLSGLRAAHGAHRRRAVHRAADPTSSSPRSAT